MASDLLGAHIGAAAALPAQGPTALPYTVLIERASQWLRRAAASVLSAPRARS